MKKNQMLLIALLFSSFMSITAQENKTTIVKNNSRCVKLFCGAPKRFMSTPLGRRYNQSMDAHHFLKVGKKNHHGSGEGLTTKEDSDGFSY